MDVELWDDALEGFMDVGHNVANGDLALSKRKNASYGSASLSDNERRVFDTWHPSARVNNNAGVAINTATPFLPRKQYGTTPVYRVTSYKVGDAVFPPIIDPEFIGRNQLVYYVLEVAPPQTTQQPNPTALMTPADIRGGKPGSTISPAFGNGTSDGHIWRVHSNLKPIKAIRVTIRFLDLTSNQLRQISIVHSLVD